MLNGRRRYLGEWGDTEVQVSFDRLVAEWLAAGRQVIVEEPSGTTTVTELVRRYKAHAEAYYRRADGTETGEATNVDHSLRPLAHLFGPTCVDDFTTKELIVVRASMIATGLARKTINQRAGIIRRAFRWGEGEGLGSGPVT